MNKLMIIDGNSLVHKAFHALPLLTNKNGMFTNAVYGFTTMLLRLLKTEKPDYVLVAFDKAKKTFRHDIYDAYKGTRKSTSDELIPQFPIVKELIEAMGIKVKEMEGYEADDILGTLAKRAEKMGMATLIVTGDKDALQLVDKNIKVLLSRKGITQLEACDEGWVEEKYGLTPEQLVDVKALMGDPSDNIPGVAGIGEKTAVKLISTYGSLEGVYEHLEDISGAKLVEKLVKDKEKAELSLKLGKIDIDVPLEETFEELRFEGIDKNPTITLFKELDFQSLIKSIDEIVKKETMEECKEEIGEEDECLEVEEADNIFEFLSWLDRVKKDKVSFMFKLDDNKLQRGNIVEAAFYDHKSVRIYRSFMSSIMDTKEILTSLFAGREEAVICHKGKDLTYLALREDIEDIAIEDISLMAYLLKAEATEYHVEDLVTEYLGKSTHKDDIAWAARDIYQLENILLKNLENEGLTSLYCNLELPLSKLLSRMELHGIKVDVEVLSALGKEFSERINNLSEGIFSLAGEEFNINSPKQLGTILFDKLRLPAIKKTKTGYSTNAEVLEKLADKHEIVSKILEYRQILKLKTTYIDGLLAIVNESGDIIHTTYNQTVAATGRLSSTDPNLQNIPIRSEEGRSIRKAFKPVNEGNLLLAADYSQIELRIVAHLADDKSLISAFLEDRDIHTHTASEVFSVPMSEVTSEMRRKAKAVNFGIIYGISDFGLARDLNIPVKEANTYIQKYFERYPAVKAFMEKTIQDGRKTGFVTTMLGRKRNIPALDSSNFALRSAAERTAINTPVQGSAADIIKLAMLKVDEALREKNLKSTMVLQVHDEIIIEVVPEEIGIVEELLRSSMENALELAVPMKVDMKIGENWYNMKEV